MNATFNAKGVLTRHAQDALTRTPQPDGFRRGGRTAPGILDSRLTYTMNSREIVDILLEEEEENPEAVGHQTLPNGDIVWYNSKGNISRLKDPAVIKPDGTKEWWQNGQRHRLDGPAIERADGRREWWVRGQRHRKGGPAVVGPGELEMWFWRDKLHRTDGPAEITRNQPRWWTNGRKMVGKRLQAAKHAWLVQRYGDVPPPGHLAKEIEQRIRDGVQPKNVDNNETPPNSASS